MEIKKFEAPDLDQALLLVKNALGDEALILHTKSRRNGWRGKPSIEITAALPSTKEPNVLGFDEVRTLGRKALEGKAYWVAVGFPGVGKTSLLVKIALHMKNAETSPRLLTFDERKIAGRSELAAYGRALRIDVGFRPTDFEGLTLADTPAFTYEEASVEEIAPYCVGRSVVLVIDVCQRLSEIQRILTRAKRLRPNAIALTKLDLVETPAIIFDIAQRAELPILGVSMSGDLTGAFKFVSPDQLAQLVLRRQA